MFKFAKEQKRRKLQNVLFLMLISAEFFKYRYIYWHTMDKTAVKLIRFPMKQTKIQLHNQKRLISVVDTPSSLDNKYL